MKINYFNHNILTNRLFHHHLPKFPKFYAIRYVCTCECVCMSVCVWDGKTVREDHIGVWNRQYPHFKISERKLRNRQRPTSNSIHITWWNQEIENTHFEIAEKSESHQSKTAKAKPTELISEEEWKWKNYKKLREQKQWQCAEIWGMSEENCIGIEEGVGNVENNQIPLLLYLYVFVLFFYLVSVFKIIEKKHINSVGPCVNV